jgi:glycosyltransferase involved in cell wall biosynthesis
MTDKKFPLVSIILPVFNGELYLRESLDSVLAQTYPRTEVIVMDDASTDGTPQIIAEYENRVSYHRQNRNKGQFANVNDGIALARGEFIAVYHADDIYDQGIVEREVEFLLAYPEAGAVFALDIFVGPTGQEYGRLTLPRELQGRVLLEYPTVLNYLLKYKNRFLVGPTAMVRASVYDELGLYRGDEFQIASDLEMWARISRGYRIGILPDYLMKYRHGHGNSTQQYYRLRTEPERYFRIMDEHLVRVGHILARPESLTAYEAHRAEDQLMLVINLYILDRREEAQVMLSGLNPKRLAGSAQVQRCRLLLLYGLLRALLRLPKLSLVADWFYQRWHVKTYPA